MHFAPNTEPSWVTVPWAAQLNPEAFTVTLWVKAASTNSGYQAPIFSRGIANTGYNIYNST